MKKEKKSTSKRFSTSDTKEKSTARTCKIRMRRSQSARPSTRKRDGNRVTAVPRNLSSFSEIQYEIKTTTGNESFQGTVVLRLHGEQTSLAIPLTSTKSGAVPFQAKAIDEFSHLDKNVGRIRKIVIEHEGASRANPLHWKKLQICKGRRIYE